MNNNLLLEAIQEAIVEIYKSEELKNLSGLTNSYELNGKPILSWHNEVTRKCWVKNAGHFNYNQNIDDLVMCSDELIYFTAHLFLYRPFLNNPLRDGYVFSGRMIYPNFQNLPAKRYAMFADIVSEKAYNYWDRIGDLIASFFPEIINPNQVFFPKAIEIIPAEFRNNENYNWLKEFKERDYVELNRKRKQVVHYRTSNTTFRHNHLEVSSDRDRMERLLEERNSLPEFFKNHLLLTIEGFEKTMLLLEEISNTLFSDMD